MTRATPINPAPDTLLSLLHAMVAQQQLVEQAERLCSREDKEIIQQDAWDARDAFLDLLKGEGVCVETFRRAVL
jgi:hypothetical protein